jgi:hypothetical protein
MRARQGRKNIERHVRSRFLRVLKRDPRKAIACHARTEWVRLVISQGEIEYSYARLRQSKDRPHWRDFFKFVLGHAAYQPVIENLLATAIARSLLFTFSPLTMLLRNYPRVGEGKHVLSGIPLPIFSARDLHSERSKPRSKTNQRLFEEITRMQPSPRSKDWIKTRKGRSTIRGARLPLSRIARDPKLSSLRLFDNR